MRTVPSILKLLAEKPDGIDAIKNCRLVTSGGSKLPDELGDMLIEAGVHIGITFGSYVQVYGTLGTSGGVLLTS